MADAHPSRALLAWIEDAEYEYFLEPVDGVATLAFGPSLANGDAQWLVTYAPEGYVNLTLIGERDGRGHWRAGFASADIAERWLTAEVGFAKRQSQGFEQLYIPSDGANVDPRVELRTREDRPGRVLVDLELGGSVLAWFASAHGAGGAAYSSHVLVRSAEELRSVFRARRADARFRTLKPLSATPPADGDS